MLASALSSWRGVIKVRVNSHRNMLAADLSSQEYLEKLLGVTEPCGMPVSTRIPADRGYSAGYLRSVEGDLAGHELQQCIESSVPVVSVHVIDSAKAATVVSRTKLGRPVPHLKQLQLWASWRRAEHRAIRSLAVEDWKVFRQLNAVSRRHSNQWKRRWEGVCSTISNSRRSSTAWRLLRSLQCGPAIRQPIPAMAISLDLTELALVDLMASQPETRPPGLPAEPWLFDGPACGGSGTEVLVLEFAVESRHFLSLPSTF
ncbi:hypothetical protein MRX96_057279 [Rhipicephalus microplus]